jgi:hypothetical protein
MQFKRTDRRKSEKLRKRRRQESWPVNVEITSMLASGALWRIVTGFRSRDLSTKRRPTASLCGGALHPCLRLSVISRIWRLRHEGAACTEMTWQILLQHGGISARHSHIEPITDVMASKLQEQCRMICDAESHICSDGLLYGLTIHRAKLCRTNTLLLEEAQNGGGL